MSFISRISFHRPIQSYSKVQRFISIFLRNRAFQANNASLRKKEYLDIGCGPYTHANFINLDYGWHPGIDLCWDITKGLPFSNETIGGIYTEHCLEHISLERVDFLLGEFWRVLKSGGCARIIVPDGELYLTRYADIVNHRTDTRLPYSQNDGYQGIYSPIMSVNRIFRAHGHCFIYDFDTLRLLLMKNGFVEIKKEAYKSGRNPQLLLDNESRAVESLYVEASKP